MDKLRKNTSNDLYDVSKYTDKELYDVLDLTEPSDRVLEAKLLILIDKYKTTPHEDGKNLTNFFVDIYNHFFGDSDEEEDEYEEEEYDEKIVEGFDTVDPLDQRSTPQLSISGTGANRSVSGGERLNSGDVQRISKEFVPIGPNGQNGSINDGRTGTIGYAGPDKGILQPGQSGPNTLKFIGDETAVTSYNNKNANLMNNKNQFDVSQNTQVGQILTRPLDYTRDNLNPLMKQTLKRIISIDSQYRDNTIYPLSTDFTFTLSDPLKNVLSLKLYSVQIPYTWYTINNDFGSNFFYIKGDIPGLNDGTFDYKIDISSGNYTPDTLISTISSSISKLKQNPDYFDTSFGTTDISYNPYNNKATITMEITQIYNETNYYLEFPTWKTPNTDPKKRLDNIPSFLGYNDISYVPFSIYSNPFTPVNNGSISVVTTYVIYDGTTTDGSANNYFDIQIYNGPAELGDNSSNILDTIKITLSNLINTVGYSQTDIITEINNQLSLNTKLISPVSSIIKITDASNVNYFNLSIKLNRKTTVNLPNLKMNIVFPIESSNSSLIWVAPTSCFHFPTISGTLNELNDIISETDSVHSAYTIPSTPYFVLRCMRPNYRNIYPSDAIGIGNYPINDLSMNYDTNPMVLQSVPGYLNYKNMQNNKTMLDVSSIDFNDYIIVMNPSTSFGDGYTHDQYISEINTVIQKTNDTTRRRNPLPGGDLNISSPATAITNITSDSSTSNLTVLTIDLTKNFDETYYTLDISDSYLHTGMGINKFYIDQNSTTIPDGSFNKIDLSYCNIFDNSNGNFVTQGGYTITGDYLLKINPKTDQRNGKDYSYIVPVPKNPDGSYITYSPWQNLQNAINAQFVAYTDISNNNSRPLANTFIDMNLSNGILYCKLTVNVENALTQNDYQLEFYDPSANLLNIYESDNKIDSNGGAPDVSWNVTDLKNSWHTNLKFPYQVVSLKNTLDVQTSYAKIISTSIFTQNQITLYDNSNNFFYIKPLPNTTGLYLSNGSNDIKIVIEALSYNLGGTQYSIQELYTKINDQFNLNPITQNSQISIYENNSTEYTKIRLNINKTYTATDYRLVFYDTTSSFVSCFVGANSVRNVSWDTSLGWILGFRESTEYFISDIISSTGSIKTITGDTCVSVNLFNYFLIVLDDYNQNHLNDGLVTVTSKNAGLPLPSYANRATYICDPVTGNTVASSSSTTSTAGLLTQHQLYALNQTINSNKQKIQYYSPGPFVKNVFGLVPMKTSGMTNGQTYVEFGGSLQNQDRTFFGPVNIKRMSVKLVSDRGDVIDLNGANWSFSLLCEQLYEQSTLK